jgi:hypothetical protein
MRRPIAVVAGEPIIYTTGAYISPTKVTVRGRSQWVWVVEELDGDTFYDGEHCDPVEVAEIANGLLYESDF